MQMELSRAKRQLQSMLMMNLEERGIVLEDIGRQVLSNGERKQPQEFVDLIGELHPFHSDTVPKVTAGHCFGSKVIGQNILHDM